MNKAQKHLALSFLLSLISINSAANCLIGEKMSTPENYFRPAGEFVFDQSTGLLWQRCSIGTKWNAEQKTCEKSPNNAQTLNWQQAININEKRNDISWRLPSKLELLSLVERACSEPAINKNVFPNTPFIGYWTSDTKFTNPNQSWYVDFKTGNLMSSEQSQQMGVRLVANLRAR